MTRIRPMTAEDWISRISPMCAMVRMIDERGAAIMRAVRIQTQAYFNRLALKEALHDQAHH